VEEAVLDGRIKATKVGGQYRITPEEVKRVMESGVLPGKGKKKPASNSQLPAEKPQTVPAPPAVIPTVGPIAAPKPEAKPAPAVNKDPPKQKEEPKKEGWSIFGAFR
jgi:hypothetical protein